MSSYEILFVGFVMLLATNIVLADFSNPEEYALKHLVSGNTPKAESIIYINDRSGNLGAVDIDTGVVNVIGNMGVVMTDIAFDPNGNLYGISFYDLYSIDPSTGSATYIGAHGIPGGNALAIGSDGTLYGAGYGTTSLYTIDSYTGSATAIGDMGYSSAGDLVFDKGNLYLTSSTGMLVNVNLQNGVAGVSAGSLGIYDVYGMFALHGGGLIGASGTQLYSIDSSSGAVTFVLDYGGQGLGRAYGASSYTKNNASGDDDKSIDPDSNYSFQTDLVVTSISVSNGKGDIPVQAEPAVLSINISNAGENPISGEISIFVEIADIENHGFADMPFSRNERVDGAALFQFASFTTRIALPPGGSHTIVVPNDSDDPFAFLSSAYSDRVRVTVRFPGDENPSNDAFDYTLPDGWPMPNGNLGVNCSIEIAAVLLAPMVKAKDAAAKSAKIMVDAGKLFYDVIRYKNTVQKGDVLRAGEIIGVWFDTNKVLGGVAGNISKQEALGYLSDGWALLNAVVNESQFLGCGEAFAISWGIGKEIVKNIFREKAKGSSQSERVFGFFAGSPVNLIIEDASGQTTSANHDLSIVKDIPNSLAYMLDVEPKHKAVVVFGNSEYTLRMVGIDQGTTNLYIIQSMLDGSLKGMEFRNIATAVNSVASVSINENVDTVELILDIDGNGVADEAKSPDQIELLRGVSSDSNTSSYDSTDAGGSGGGCTINKNAAVDPLFPLLIICSLFYLVSNYLPPQALKTPGQGVQGRGFNSLVQLHLLVRGKLR